MSIEALTGPAPKKKAPKEKAPIPQQLVRETIDGVPFYYVGYRDVLNKTKKTEDIMADSGLQIVLKNYLKRLLDNFLDEKLYWVFSGEVGSHLDHRSNLGLDVAVYDRQVLTPAKITSKYIEVSPKIVVEIDVKVELAEPGSNIFEEYVLRKVRKLHQFGCEKIVWIFTRSKTVIVARPDNTWDVLEWDTDVELLDGLHFNIPQYLQAEGIDPDA